MCSRHEHCNRNGHTFDSAVYNLQASGYPTFWRSFKCVAASAAAGEMQLDLLDTTNTTSTSSQDSAEMPPTDIKAGQAAGDNIFDWPAPVTENFVKAERAEGGGHSDTATSEKWTGCPPSVAGVPLNHCGSSAGTRAVFSDWMKLAFDAGLTVAMLL